ncbi:MAG: alkaline phosphatase family protein [Myxococcota bacterium]|nr:alkaline phosphatase family protein [Myxococcota bacterium]
MTRNTKRILVGALVSVAVVGAGGLAYLEWADVPLDELGELVAEGPIERLDPSPEAHPGGARVLVFALDGVGAQTFFEVVEAGEMPSVGALIGEARGEDGQLREHGWIVPDALSILPSTTVAAWSSTFSGEPVSRTGVAGNEWFVREEMRFLAPAPVSVHGGAHTLRALNDGLVGDAVQAATVYERLRGRSHVSLMPVYRGADVYTVPDPTAVSAIFETISEAVLGEHEVTEEAYREVDTGSVDSIAQAVREHGLPTLQVVYFPGIDLYTHVAREPLEAQRRYLREVLDPAIARVLELYRERGELERTWVMFVSDHGHTPVLEDDAHALGVGTSEADEPTAILEAGGFRVRPFELEADRDDYQAVLAYQGAIAYVYLADRASCPEEGQRCDWRRAPRLEEDVLPVVRAIDEAARGERALGGLAGAIDLIFAREPRAIGQDALPYEVWDGEQLVPVREWLAANPRPDLLELADRMDALSAGPHGHRAGDVLLLARSGLDRPIEERFYFSGPYRSWHGSPAASDSRITFAVARASQDGAAIRTRVRESIGERPSQLDVADLILALASDDD